MSSNLEYPPLFIFVLTLTYKKKKEEQFKKPQQQKECFDVGEGWSVSPSLSHGGMRTGPGNGCRTQVLIPGCPGEHKPFSSRHLDTGHWELSVSTTSWARPITPLMAPLKCYVTRCSDASSLDQEDTRRG